MLWGLSRDAKGYIALTTYTISLIWCHNNDECNCFWTKRNNVPVDVSVWNEGQLCLRVTLVLRELLLWKKEKTSFFFLQGKFPWKWMAPEILSRTCQPYYSTKSDVWVVLCSYIQIHMLLSEILISVVRNSHFFLLRSQFFSPLCTTCTFQRYYYNFKNQTNCRPDVLQSFKHDSITSIKWLQQGHRYIPGMPWKLKWSWNVLEFYLIFISFA